MSSAMLSQLLRKLREAEEYERVDVSRVDFSYGKMTIFGKSLKVQCEVEAKGAETLAQEEVNWNWVFDLVSSIQDQPIVIEVTQNHIRISVDY